MDGARKQLQSKATLTYLEAMHFPGKCPGPVVALKVGDEVLHRNPEIGRGVVTDTWVGQAMVLFRGGPRLECSTADLCLWKCA